jgi:DNA polymerase III delta prime subunit
MRNIWFTIYTGSIEQYSGIANYRTLLEILLIPAIQDKINREKKIQKYMLMFSDNIEVDNIELFKDLHYEKKVRDGIVNLYVSTKDIDWNKLSEQERKNFLIEKWKVLFDNLSDDYFITDKLEVLKSLDKVKNQEWRITSSPFKKKLKYNKEVFTVVMDISTERAQLALVRVSDEKWFALKDFETWKIQSDANFKNFKLDGDILTFGYKNIFNTMFESPAIFDLKEVIK